ncbi:MAG: protein-tyrosine phosphatase family protein [Planctomycetota bacterium]
MIFGPLLLALAAVLAALGPVYAPVIGPAAWVFLWPAAALGYGGLAYVLDRPAWLGKDLETGAISPLRLALLLHFFAPTWLALQLKRLGPEPAMHEVAPGLWLSRRPVRSELPPDTALIVDLTAELPVHRSLRDLPRCAVPTLDATPPDPELVRAALARIEATTGPVVIHCAAGHGRSATVAALVLLRRGLASDAADAEAKLRAVRPGVKLKAAQRRLVEALSQG